MTAEELRWKLREFDDDTTVEVLLPDGRFGEPKITVVERDALNDEGKPCKQWVLRLT